MNKRQNKANPGGYIATWGETAGAGAKLAFSGFGSSLSSISYLAEIPDVSRLEDPNIAVIFKNFTKKDESTRAKAVEELKVNLESLDNSRETLRDEILNAWTQVFPRLSTDLSRRVRQPSFDLQGSLFHSAGKKAAPLLPKVVGPWLAGLYDSDKSVARSADQGLRLVFPGPEKTLNLRRAYQKTIIGFCADVILMEHPYSLSDERNTSEEDARAKYDRLLASVVSLIRDLLTSLSLDEIRKCSDNYDRVLHDSKTWELVSSLDPRVRRETLRLMRVCPDVPLFDFKLNELAKALMSKKTLKSQAGSALEFTETLKVLSSRFESFWNEDCFSKATGAERISTLVKSGSQGGPERFWENMVAIFATIPPAKLPQTLDGASDIVSNVYAGLSRRDEPRSHTTTAWSFYLVVIERFAKVLTKEDNRLLLEKHASPIVARFVFPASENSKRPVPGVLGTSDRNIVAKLALLPSDQPIFMNLIPSLSTELIEHIGTSAPEQSKDFKVSQDDVAAQGERFFQLQVALLDQESGGNSVSPILQTATKIVHEAADLLQRRTGKPYSAASIILSALLHFRNRPEILSVLKNELEDFVKQGFSLLIDSPSSDFASDIMAQFGDYSWFQETWNSIIDELLGNNKISDVPTLIRRFCNMSCLTKESALPVKHVGLQKWIMSRIQAAYERRDWKFLSELLASKVPILSEATAEEVLDELASNLQHGRYLDISLKELKIFAESGPVYVKEYLKKETSTLLMQNILLLTESNDEELSTYALEVQNELQMAAASKEQTPMMNPTLRLIQSGYEAKADSPKVTTLQSLALSFLNSHVEDREAAIADVIPELERWQEPMELALTIQPIAALEMMNELSGAVAVVEKPDMKSGIPELPTDTDGLSTILRMSIFSFNILQETNVLQSFLESRDIELYAYLLWTAILADDCLAFQGANHTFSPKDTEDSQLVSDFVLGLEDVLIASPLRSQLQQFFWNNIRGNDPKSFYSARAYVKLADSGGEVANAHEDDPELYLKSLITDNKELQLAALLLADRERLLTSKVLIRYFNELISSITTLDIEKNLSKGLYSLVLLNILLANEEDAVHTVTKQRIIFFIKHIIPWLSSVSVDLPIKTEVCKALLSFLPAIADLYGDHWTDVLEFITVLWKHITEVTEKDSSSPLVPLLYSSIRLYTLLKSLTKQTEDDNNDDLIEAFDNHQRALAEGLILLLEQFRDIADSKFLTMQKFNEALSRAVLRAPVDVKKHSESLYPILAAKSPAIQHTAYDLLHRHIPKDQEELSTAVVLEKTTARLPDQLLSLVMTAPSSDEIFAEDLEKEMPLAVRQYLSSWLLIFDHFVNASDKVKTDYSHHIRDEQFLDGLLDFTFEVLGHSEGKPVDTSGIDATVYDFNIASTPLKDIQWLLTHLYYLSLRHLSSLVKQWWSSCRSRQTAINVETWTEKFISPNIISDALLAVEQWAAAQKPPAEEQLTVKVSRSVREVTVAKDVDDQTLSFLIRLPKNFPLSQADVVSGNRVVVNEKTWQGWLMTSRGAIVFSNNSLVDGIIAFRRNLMGALEGQSECAICYSIFGSDKQMPTKKCGTCRNVFHGSCLYRWFQSSNSSSCPLCRNPFNYFGQ